MHVESSNAASFAPTPLRLATVKADAGKDLVGPSSLPGAGGGIRVSLSEAGSAQSKQATKNQDIDDSNLPDSIKNTLKMIRQLRAQLASKQAQLSALLAKPPTRDSQREANVVSSEIASLHGAISSANASLVSQMRQQNLSSEQLMSVATLMVS